MSELLGQTSAEMSAGEGGALHFGNWAAAATAAQSRQQHRQVRQQQQDYSCCEYTFSGIGRKHSIDGTFPPQHQQQREQGWDDTTLVGQGFVNGYDQEHNQDPVTNNSMSNSTAAACSKRARTAVLSPFLAASTSMAFSPAAAAAGHTAAADCTAASSVLKGSGSLSELRNRSITSRVHPFLFLRNDQQQQQQQPPVQLVDTDPMAVPAITSGWTALSPAGVSSYGSHSSALFNSSLPDTLPSYCWQQQQQQQAVPEPSTPCCSSVITGTAAACAARTSKGSFLSTLGALSIEHLQELSSNIEDKINGYQNMFLDPVTLQSSDTALKLRTLLRLKAQVCKEILARTTCPSPTAAAPTVPAAAAAAEVAPGAATDAALTQTSLQQMQCQTHQQSWLLQQLRQPKKLQLPQMPQPLQLLQQQQQQQEQQQLLQQQQQEQQEQQQLLQQQQQQEQQQMLQQALTMSMLAQQGSGGLVMQDPATATAATTATTAAAATNTTSEQQFNEGAMLDPAMAAALPVPVVTAAAATAPKGSSSSSSGKAITSFADSLTTATAAAGAAAGSSLLATAWSAPQEVPGFSGSEKVNDSLAIWGGYQGLAVTDIPPGWHNNVLQGLEEPVPVGLAAAAPATAAADLDNRPWNSAPLVAGAGGIAQQQQQQQVVQQQQQQQQQQQEVPPAQFLENASSRISCNSPLLVSTSAAAAAASPSSRLYPSKLLIPAATPAAGTGAGFCAAGAALPDLLSPTASVSDVSQIPKTLPMAGDFHDVITPAAVAAVNDPDPFSSVDDFLEGLGSLEALAATPPHQGLEHCTVMAMLNSSQGLPRNISPRYNPSSSPEVLSWQQQQQRSHSSSSGLVLPETLTGDRACGPFASAAGTPFSNTAAAKPPLAPAFALDKWHSWQQQQSGIVGSGVGGITTQIRRQRAHHTKTAGRKHQGKKVQSPDIWERSRCMSDSGCSLPATSAAAAAAGQSQQQAAAAQDWQQQQLSAQPIPPWLQVQIKNREELVQLQQELPPVNEVLSGQHQQQQGLERHWSAPTVWCQFDRAADAPAIRTESCTSQPPNCGSSSSSQRRQDNISQQQDHHQQQQQQWKQFFSNSKLPPVGSVKYQRLQQVWGVIKARDLVRQLPPEAVAVMTQLELNMTAATPTAAAAPALADTWPQQQQQAVEQQGKGLDVSSATTCSSASLMSQQQQQQQGDLYATVCSVPTPELSPSPAGAAAAGAAGAAAGGGGSTAGEVFRSVSGELAAAISHLRTHSTTHSQATAAAAAAAGVVEQAGALELSSLPDSRLDMAGPATHLTVRPTPQSWIPTAPQPDSQDSAAAAAAAAPITLAADKGTDVDEESPFFGAFGAAAVASAVEGDVAKLGADLMDADTGCGEGWLDGYDWDLVGPQRSLPLLQLSGSTEVSLAGLL